MGQPAHVSRRPRRLSPRIPDDEPSQKCVGLKNRYTPAPRPIALCRCDTRHARERGECCETVPHYVRLERKNLSGPASPQADLPCAQSVRVELVNHGSKEARLSLDRDRRACGQPVLTQCRKLLSGKRHMNSPADLSY